MLSRKQLRTFALLALALLIATVAGLNYWWLGANTLPPHWDTANHMMSALKYHDVLAQCAVMGDLHHALAAGAMRREDVHAELGEVVCGSRPGRRSAEEIFVFDSTGMALQDVAAAAVVYRRAVKSGRGVDVEM